MNLRKVLSAVVAATMAVSVLSAVSFADATRTGTGIYTKDLPWEVTNTTDVKLNIGNQWNDNKAFESPVSIAAETNTIAIDFTVTGVDGTYKAYPYGAISEWAIGAWSNADAADSYATVFGTAYPSVTISADGNYTLYWPIADMCNKAVLLNEDEEEYQVDPSTITVIDMLEIMVEGAAESNMSFEFTAIRELTEVMTLAALNNVSPAPAATEAPATTEAPAATTTTAPATDKGSPDTGAAGVAGIVAVAVIAAGAVAVSRKRK